MRAAVSAPADRNLVVLRPARQVAGLSIPDTPVRLGQAAPKPRRRRSAPVACSSGVGWALVWGCGLWVGGCAAGGCGGGCGGLSARSLGGGGGGGLWARRVGWGPLRGPWGVLAVLVVRGLPGVGPVLASAGAAVLVCWTVGVAPWGACELWLARGLGQVTTRGRVAALPPGLGAGRPGRQRAGAGVWPQQGHRGARVGSPRRGRLRPAAPGPGRAPPVRSSRLGPPGHGRRGEPTNGQPPVAVAGRDAPGNPPCGRGGPAKPRPVTRPPLHLPRQPQKRERQHPREPPTANPDDRPHRPRDPTLRETPTPDQEPAPHPTTHTPTPQTPHTHKQTGQSAVVENRSYSRNCGSTSELVQT